MNVRTRICVLLLLIVLGSCTDPNGRSDSRNNLPFAKKQNAQIAARDCGVDEWQLVQMLAIHGPPPEEPHFSYELESLASEEIGADQGRTWDRTKRIETINACLCASFERQRVRFGIAAPALVETVLK